MEIRDRVRTFLEHGPFAGNRSQGTVPIFAAAKVSTVKNPQIAAKMGLSPWP